ncbi:MAG: cation:proton antiporter, partial [Spirochaetota bacterium]|nr:cation:proton antiporter [Spirochaetota bacterium]
METPLLKDIIIIFGLSVLILFVFHRIRLPAIVGFLFTGILVGPYGLGLIQAIKDVESLAEVGVVLLLFIVGIEFSLKKLIQIKRSILIGGSTQVLLTILLTSFFAIQLGINIKIAIFIGFLLSLSSTAIVLKYIQDKREIDTPHGRTTLAILIFQDIIFVPMMLIIPILSGTDENIFKSLLLLLAKGISIIFLMYVCIKWLIPKVLHYIILTRSRELFIFSVLSICFAMSWFTHILGLSFALGGFLAGLIISETEYGHHAISNVLSFRDILTSLFFISVGMLFDINFLLNEPLIIISLTASIVIIKSIVSIIASATIGYPLRTNVLVGLSISQIGEFSFVLIASGVQHKLISHGGNIYNYILSITILTMTITPFIMKLSLPLSKAVLRLGLPKKLLHGWYTTKHEELKAESLRDHLVIIGFAVNGKNLAKAAKLAKIPYVIIEMNPETVKKERAKGEPIYFGDASYELILEQVNCEMAKVVVVAISDFEATERIITTIRKLYPDIYIIARTHFFQDMLALYKLGADDVIPQEYETSVEIFARVMV